MHQRSVSHKHHASLVNLVYKKRLFFTYSSETILHNMSKTRSHLDFLTYLSGTKNLHIDNPEMTKKAVHYYQNDNLHILLVCHEVWESEILHQPHMHSRAEKEGARKKINLSEVSTTSASTWRSSRKVCVMLSLLCAFTYRDLNRLK